MELWKQPWRSASPGSALAGTYASPSPLPLGVPAQTVRVMEAICFFTRTCHGAAGEHYWRDYLLSKPSTSVLHPPAAMEYLLSAAASHSTLPEHRSPASSAVVALPVIDLSALRVVARRAVLEADRELGFFQVYLGVPAQAVRDTARPNTLFTSTTRGAANELFWRDCGTFPVAADAKDA